MNVTEKFPLRVSTGSHQGHYISDDEFDIMVRRFTATATKVFENENLVTERVEVRSRLGLLQRLRLKKPHPTYPIQGVRFGTELRAGEGVAFMEDGIIMIAVKIVSGKYKGSHEVYTVRGYLYDWLTDARRKSLPTIRDQFTGIQQSLWNTQVTYR